MFLKNKKRTVIYRSFKQFNEVKYLKDVSSIPFHVAEIFDCVDDAYWMCNVMLKDVVDEHAPLKTRFIKHNQVPYMNNELRKLINVKNMLKRKYDRQKNTSNWENYRKKRNAVTSLRKKSLKEYMKGKCENDCTKFWDTVKPIISDKCKSSGVTVTLMEESKVINDPIMVGNTFNKYYVDITKAIGQPDLINADDTIENILNKHRENEYVKRIRGDLGNPMRFMFKKVTIDEMYKKLNTINHKKATGFDRLPPKLIKLGAKVLCGPMVSLMNMSIEQATFPNALKCAEVIPIFKKGDMLDKKNYRPVSILPCISKIFEGILIDQLKVYFEGVLSPHLSGFRKGYNCQSVLLNFVEKCKVNLDNNQVYGALLTDLSKAFDCLPHCLLLSKLNAYGVDVTACKLIASYFKERKQRVSICNNKSSWLELSKGAPQGSLFGPFAFNLFINDLLHIISNMEIADLFNYADDNSVACHDVNYEGVCKKLEKVSNIMLKWFTDNYMQANPSKFQLILFGSEHLDSSVVVDDIVIKAERCVKLLGVNIDCTLGFNEHINETCKKAGRKLNVLGRLCKTLNVQDKLKLYQAFILSQFNYCPCVAFL